MDVTRDTGDETEIILVWPSSNIIYTHNLSDNTLFCVLYIRKNTLYYVLRLKAKNLMIHYWISRWYTFVLDIF